MTESANVGCRVPSSRGGVIGTTLKDVARLARVSVRTVSNVVNGYPHVSDDVRRRVRAAIEQLDYRPNLIARTLRTGRTGVLSLVVPETDLPGFDQLAREVVVAAAEVGYRVVVDQARPDRSDRPMLVDGVLLSARTTASFLDAHATAGIPVVLLGEHTTDARCDHVAIDDARAAQDATEHLLRTGRRRIAAIGARPYDPSAAPQPRTAGYRRALRHAGLTPPAGYLQPALHHRRADGYRATRLLLDHDQRPDAIFCYSDPLAIGAMRAAFDAGLRIPDDLAVIGIGDLEEGRYSRPTLSTVSVDTAFIARHAVTRIAARVARPDALPVAVTAPHTVLGRESTG